MDLDDLLRNQRRRRIARELKGNDNDSVLNQDDDKSDKSNKGKQEETPRDSLNTKVPNAARVKSTPSSVERDGYALPDSISLHPTTERKHGASTNVAAHRKPSPSTSSLSFSQSPDQKLSSLTKLTTGGIHGRCPKWGSFDEDNSSSEDEDLQELSRKLERMKRSQEQQESVEPSSAVKATPSAIDASAAVAPLASSVPCEDERSVSRTEAEAATGRDHCEQPNDKESHLKLASVQRRYFLDDDDDDDDDEGGLVEIARKLDQRNGNDAKIAATEDKSGVAASAAVVPKNPLRLMKANEQRIIVDSQSQETPLKTDALREQLWDDDNNGFGDDITKNEKVVRQQKSGTTKETCAAGHATTKGSSARKRRRNSDATTTTSAEKTTSSKISNKRPAKPLETHIEDEFSCIEEEDREDLERQLKPDFVSPKFGPFDCIPLVLGTTKAYRVPASINRYLPRYQQVGVRFLYDRAIDPNVGAILGDDMGLGKTVQIIALLAALLEKEGNGLDLLELSRRRKESAMLVEELRKAKQDAIVHGNLFPSEDQNSVAERVGLPRWAPVLIVVPPRIIENWEQDFASWGHFSVAVYEGQRRELSLDQVLRGTAEVLVCARSLFARPDDLAEISRPSWKLIVVDEFHLFKSPDGMLATHLRQLRDEKECAVIGLTGTLMQNKHDELWSLMDLVAKGYLGPWKAFKEEYSNPIKLSRTKDANKWAIELGAMKGRELTDKIRKHFIRRTKDDVLKDELPTKVERIIFCEPSRLQKKVYQHMLKQPDFRLLTQAAGPCDCGVNRKFFLEYQNLQSQEQRIEYQRQHKKDLVTRSECCYSTPRVPKSDAIDPNAILWRQQHLDNRECRKCPFCISFPALNLLYKLSSHVALLQPTSHPDTFGRGTKEHQRARDELERAKIFLPAEIVDELPGKSYIRADSIMNDHFSLSGKMVVLHKLLHTISIQQGRVLLFSASTQSLDLIQNYIRSRGYEHLRMDGSSSAQQRKDYVKEFKRNSNIFVFLLSTKAMGLGLNLTEANFVIIFDVEWNPSYDAQAQDRAYRIGQERDVKVFRLVSRGTIEELKYLRQVYKTQLKSETLVDVEDSHRQEAARLFRGVDGDKSRKGELFGMANLLKFKDGTFMDYHAEKEDSRKFRVGVHDTNSLWVAVKDMTEDELDGIGEDGNVFEDLAKRTVGIASDAQPPDEETSDLALGGESQAIMALSDNAILGDEQSESNELKEVAKTQPSLLKIAEKHSMPTERKHTVIKESKLRPPRGQENKQAKSKLAGTTGKKGKWRPTSGKATKTTFSALDIYMPSQRGPNKSS